MNNRLTKKLRYALFGNAEKIHLRQFKKTNKKNYSMGFLKMKKIIYGFF